MGAGPYTPPLTNPIHPPSERANSPKSTYPQPNTSCRACIGPELWASLLKRLGAKGSIMVTRDVRRSTHALREERARWTPGILRG
jgi:hypothetical protein